MKQSSESYKKDVYYRLLKNGRYNYRKLLLPTSIKLIEKLSAVQNSLDTKVLIIDDIVEIKEDKQIDRSCKTFGVIKKRAIKGLNIVIYLLIVGMSKQILLKK